MSNDTPPVAPAANLSSVMHDRHVRSTAFWLFVLMTSVYFLTAQGRVDIVDGAMRFDVTHNLIELGRPVLRHRFPAVQGPDLDFYAHYEFGTSVLAMPLVLLARWLAPGSLDAEQFAFTLTTIPFAALTVCLLFLAFIRLGSTLPSARNWALACGFGSMLWPYAGSTFDMAPQAFFLTLGILAGADAFLFQSAKLGMLSGFAFFGLATIQETYLILAGPVVLAVSRLDWREPFRNLRRPAFIWIAAGLAAGLLAVLFYNYLRFEDPFRTGRESQRHPTFGNPLLGLAGLLLSPAKCLFLYSPLHVLGLVGLCRLWRKELGWVLPALTTFVAQVLLISCLAYWAGDWAWGPRYLLATAPLVLLGVPFALSPAKRNVQRAFVCVAVLVQLLGLSIDQHVYYFNKKYRPHFWLINATMYTDSPLLRRPQEIWKALHFEGYRPGMKLVPGVYDDLIEPPPAANAPDWIRAYALMKRPERVVTSGDNLPPTELRLARPHWVEDYYVLNAPRPWVLWSAGLPRELRPVPLWPWLGLGLLGLLLSAWQLFRTTLPRAASASSALHAETRTG